MYAAEEEEEQEEAHEHAQGWNSDCWKLMPLWLWWRTASSGVPGV
jgi:hypothetical protein